MVDSMFIGREKELRALEKLYFKSNFQLSAAHFKSASWLIDNPYIRVYTIYKSTKKILRRWFI